MGAADDGDINAGLAERLHSRAHRLGIGCPVRDRRAVPVEDDRLERAVRDGHQRGDVLGVDGWRAGRGYGFFNLLIADRLAPPTCQ
ncbi:MAG TPA: hypothetical protein VF990_17230 [Candidatus Dormibacteraeota bacterium]